MVLWRGVKQDLKKAVEFYRQAAEQELAEAQFNLGAMYENGVGVKQDYSKAVEWYTKVAEQNFIGALVNLGNIYYDKRNYAKAAELYRRGAEQGDSLAQNNLATLYLDGKGVKQDYKRAAELYRQTAEQRLLTHHHGTLLLLPDYLPKIFSVAPSISPPKNLSSTL